MIITLYSNIYKPFSHGYPKLYKSKGSMTHNKRVVLYMPFRSSTKIVPKGRGFDSVGDFDFKIPSPIAGEPKSIKQRIKETE